MQNILITGANKGIGLQLVKAHIKRGNKVFAVCRTPSDELNVSGAEIIANIDFLNKDFEQTLLEKVSHLKFDRVIANAGIWQKDTLTSFTPDSIRNQFEVNALAPIRLIKALESQLMAGSKIILMSTRVASHQDNTSGEEYGYRMSKSALNMAGINLAHTFKERKIAVLMIHPGFVRTALTEGEGFINADYSAEKVLQISDELTLINTGSFWHAIEKQPLPW